MLYEAGLATKAAQTPSVALGLLHFSYSYRLLLHTPDTSAAVSHARKAVEILERTVGPEAYDTIAARDNLASQLTTSGAVAQGLNLAESNYETAERALGDNKPLTWHTANNFAEGLRSIGRPEAAIPIDRMLLKKRIAHSGEGSIQALVSASNLALNYLLIGDKDEALRYFALQARLGAKLADPTSEHEAQGMAWIDALYGVAEAHVRNQEPEQALALFRQLDERLHDWALQEIGNSGNRFLAETTRVLADNFLYAFGRFALEAEAARPAFADAAARWKTMESGARVRLRQMVDTLPMDMKRDAQEVIRLLGEQQEVMSARRTAVDRVADAALAEEARQKLATLDQRLKDLPTVVGDVAHALGDKDALVNYVVITRRGGLRSSADAIKDERLLAVVRRKDGPRHCATSVSSTASWKS